MIPTNKIWEVSRTRLVLSLSNTMIDMACFYTGTKLCKEPAEFVTDLHSENLNDVFKSVQLPHSLFTEVYYDVSFEGSSLYLLEYSRFVHFQLANQLLCSCHSRYSYLASSHAGTTWSGSCTCAAYGDRVDTESIPSDQFKSLLMPADLNVIAYRDDALQVLINPTAHL